MAGFNFSAFFGGSNNSFGFGSIDFSEYNMIKSGAYKKVLKSYYAQQKDTTSKTDKTDNKKKTEEKDTTGLTKMKSEADALKKSAEAFDKSDLFRQKNGVYDTDKIAGAVKDFVKEYNNTLAQSGNVIAKDVTQQVNYMKSMTGTMSNALSKVGVTVGTDGKLSVNEDTLKGADMKDVKALFSGSHSYAGQIATKASAIGSAAVRSSSIYGSNGTLSSGISGMFDNWI